MDNRRMKFQFDTIVVINYNIQSCDNSLEIIVAIKVDGKVIKAKIKAPRSSHAADEKYTGTEPVWDPEVALKMTDAEFDHHMRRSFQYYNYHYSSKDLKKYVVEWAQNSEIFDKATISAFIKSSDRTISQTACNVVMAHRQGMPLKERHVEYLKSSIQKAISLSDVATETLVETQAKPEVYRPTIQDRLNEKTSEILGEMEGLYDDFVTAKKPFKLYDFLTRENVPQSQLIKFEKLWSDRKSELTDAQTKKDAQLTEGYSHYKLSDFKRIIAFIDECLKAIDQYRGVKQATKKVRIKRAPSKEKLVSKLKYAKEDKSLKLVSINPADIVGASVLWIYNVRTRKLGKYVADSHSGTLGIKGTTLLGFDETRSVCKTLRKPEEKLQEFRKASKVQLRKFLEDIRATETKMNGRINSDTILLKVE